MSQPDRGRRGRAPRLAVIVIAALATVGLTACGGTAPSGGGGSSQPSAGGGGTLTVGIRETVQSYDPASYRSRITESILANIFDELVVRTPDQKIVPDLATSWTQDDATHWTFKIRDGVKFQDGSSLTAEDVKFTLDRVSQKNGLDGQTSVRQGLLPSMEPATVADPQTVKLTLKSTTPADILLAGLSHIQIVPKALLEKEGTAAFAQHPVGSGPFSFESGTLDAQTILTRFPGYWGGPPELGTPGPASLDKVVFKVIPELSSEIAALKAGDIQIVQGVPPDNLADLQADSSLQVKSYPGTRTTWLAMNVTKAPFDKVEVRQAMNYAIDSNAIIKSILHDQAVRMTGPVPPFSAFYDSSLQPYAHDVAKAKQLLAAGGYPNGFQLQIDCVASFKNIAQVIAQQLADVGIQASVRVWDSSSLQKAGIAGERQAILWDWGNSFRHPFDLLNPTLMTKGRGNYSQYANPQVDELLNQGATTTDKSTAEQAYKQAQDIMYNDAPWVFGWIPNEIEAASAKVQNWNPGPDGWEFLLHVSLGK